MRARRLVARAAVVVHRERTAVGVGIRGIDLKAVAIATRGWGVRRWASEGGVRGRRRSRERAAIDHERVRLWAIGDVETLDPDGVRARRRRLNVDVLDVVPAIRCAAGGAPPE